MYLPFVFLFKPKGGVLFLSKKRGTSAKNGSVLVTDAPRTGRFEGFTFGRPFGRPAPRSRSRRPPGLGTSSGAQPCSSPTTPLGSPAWTADVVFFFSEENAPQESENPKYALLVLGREMSRMFNAEKQEAKRTTKEPPPGTLFT